MRRAAPLLIALGLACDRGGAPAAHAVVADSQDVSASPPPAVSIGSPAPEYTARTLSGTPVSLGTKRGAVVLLNIWATWCGPCRREIPVLERLHLTYAPRGLAIIGVSVDAPGDEASIRAFASRMQMTYAIWRDPDERVSSTFHSVGVPGSFLIDRSGVLRWRHIGPIAADDSSLTRVLLQALAAPSF